MPNSPQDAATLCLACGLCCNGTLHKIALLAPQEIDFAESLGLTTRATPNKAAFDLPCPCWQQGRCNVYPLRPNVCETYRCKLLRALDAQEVTLEAALTTIAQAQKLIDEIEAMTGNLTLPGSIWTRLHHFAKQQGYDYESLQFAQAFPALKLKATALHWLLQSHFRRSKPEAAIA